MNDLFRIHTFYKFSLESFLVVVTRAINMVEEGKLVFDLPAENEEGGEGAEKEEGEGEEEKPKDEEPKEEEEAKPEGDGENQEEGEEGEEEDGDKLLEVSPRALAKRVEAITESLTF